MSKNGDNDVEMDSSLFQPPQRTHNKSPLKIEVPKTQSTRNLPVINNTPSLETHDLSLGDPIKLSPLSSSKYVSPSINFDQITQLPTPVINDEAGGQFHNFIPNSIDMPKRTNSLTRYSPTKARVTSEYKPLVLLGRKNSLVDLAKSRENLFSKRITSNPVGPESSQLISPPIEPIQSKASKYSNQIFHAVITNNYYKFHDQIGTGTFSTVISASNVKNEADRVAIKIISIPTSSNAEIGNFKSFIKREISILKLIHHPCLVDLIDFNINISINFHLDDDDDKEKLPEISATELANLKYNNDQLLFLNYCQGGNLFEFLLTYSKLNYFNNVSYWKVLKRVICEVIIGISYLHHKDIIHRDIKLENILLNYHFNDLCEIVNTPTLMNLNLCCVSDFGLSKKLPQPDHLLSTRCGSQDYIAPEILMGVKYNGKLTDSWSIGVLIYSLLENRLPFDLPPVDLLTNSGVSPSVIKRRRARNNPAHRIAMIDWDWVLVAGLDSEKSQFRPEVAAIIKDLKLVVDLLLVRKDKRVPIGELIELPQFAWIKQSIPDLFYSF